MRSLRIGMPIAAAVLAVGCVAASATSDEGAQSQTAGATPASPSLAAAEAVSAPAPASVPARPDFSYEGQTIQGGWIRGQVPSGTVSARLDTQELTLDDDGNFFAAFNRDAGTEAVLVADLADGASVTQTIAVAPRAWNIEHVNVARSAGGASASFMERRRPELAQINAARNAEAPASGWSEDFIWPLTGRISGRFGSQRVYRGEPGSYHSGIDIATGSSGNPFVAPAAGVVTLATSRPFSLEGNLLIIDHGQGLNSAFLHLSEISVSEGDVVTQGQVLGRIGSTGRATGPHLHWSMKWRDARVDPLLFTGPMP